MQYEESSVSCVIVGEFLVRFIDWNADSTIIMLSSQCLGEC